MQDAGVRLANGLRHATGEVCFRTSAGRGTAVPDAPAPGGRFCAEDVLAAPDMKTFELTVCGVDELFSTMRNVRSDDSTAWL